MPAREGFVQMTVGGLTLDPVTKQPRLACGAALAGGEVWVKGKRLTLDDLANTPVHDPLWATHLELGGPR